MRAFSPKKDKETRNPFAPKKVNGKEPKPPKTHEPDKWDGGGGSVYHTRCTSTPSIPTQDPASQRKRTEGIKRQLKGSEREREIRRSLKSFAPARPNARPTDENQETPAVGEETSPLLLLEESKAFDAKRVRQIGFDPRRRVNEEGPNVQTDRKVSPILGGGVMGGKISLERVLGDVGGVAEREEVDSDSDSDLDIIMTGE